MMKKPFKTDLLIPALGRALPQQQFDKNSLIRRTTARPVIRLRHNRSRGTRTRRRGEGPGTGDSDDPDQRPAAQSAIQFNSLPATPTPAEQEACLAGLARWLNKLGSTN
jgi:hypothetical protein